MLLALGGVYGVEKMSGQSPQHLHPQICIKTANNKQNRCKNALWYLNGLRFPRLFLPHKGDPCVAGLTQLKPHQAIVQWEH